eukprot:356367-Chlamydomonas_euryale.AAC.3
MGTRSMCSAHAARAQRAGRLQEGVGRAGKVRSSCAACGPAEEGPLACFVGGDAPGLQPPPYAPAAWQSVTRSKHTSHAQGKLAGKAS